MHPIHALIHAADQAINREDWDALMAFYHEDATLVVKPGLQASGKAEIRTAFGRIAEFFQHRLRVTQDQLVVVAGGDTALVLAHAKVEAEDALGAPLTLEREATYVFRREPGGPWLCAVDNSYGTSLLRS